MRKIMAGIIGAGFISISHLDAIRRIGFADIIGITDVNYELARKKAEEYGIPRCYRSVDELLADDNINVVHNCTPNHLHLEINKKIIKAGKHVFSEKPLAMNTTESQEMLDLVNEHKELVHGVNFNYRMNPLVQDIKHKISNGEIGTPKLVHGSYLQDWLLFDTDYNWRLEPELGGASRCIADIGSHWMDMAQTVTGAKITEVCADLVVVLPVRKKTRSTVETFSQNTDMEYEEKEIKTEDYGAVLLFEYRNQWNEGFAVLESGKCRSHVDGISRTTQYADYAQSTACGPQGAAIYLSGIWPP
jgi:predicted dehydrogenase